MQVKAEIEKMGTEMRAMFEQIMAKEGKTQGSTSLDSSHGKGVDCSSPLKSVSTSVAVNPVEMTSGDFNRSCKHGRLECPRFDGDNFSGWLMKTDQFFEAEGVADNAKVRAVMMHLEGRALQWHQYYVRSRGSSVGLEWAPYLEEMRRRFGDTEFSDPMSDIVTLKQYGSVDNYYDEFLSLLNSLQLSSDYGLSIFISNLKPDISKTVRLFFPKTLSHAFSLAKQIESLNYASPRKTFTPYKNPPQAPPYSFNPIQHTVKPSTLPPLLPTPNIPMLPAPPNTNKHSFNPNTKPSTWNSSFQNTKSNHMPNKQERDERRKNGLCMWCGVKFTRGHTCYKSQLYQMLVEGSDDTEEDTDLFLDCEDSIATDQKVEESPVISLHALTGTTDYHTMRVQGKIKNQLVNILVDTGSTHNFVDQQMVKQLGVKLKTIQSFMVTVANGDKLQAQQGCPNLTWEVQGIQQTSDFFLSYL